MSVHVFTNRIRAFVAAIVLVFLASQGLGQDCPSGALSKPKGNKIYLYFPTAQDNSFPEYHCSDTSPLEAFDVADLDAAIGSTAQLRNRIFQIVTEDYCEIDVEVAQTTSAPSPSEARWQIVGIGSDSEPGCSGGNLFGVAQDVDIDDDDVQDYARVWAGSFDAAYGGSGGALNGSNSTLERWARAIGHTTSHEAGHNYGLGHTDSRFRTGTSEDGQKNHVLATGSEGGLTGEDRASRRRHFSDTSYEILAHNIGLNVKTLYNWDFANPNDTDAHSMELTILSTASSLTIGWWYNGSRSPWRDPTISSTGSTVTFKGTSYNEFILTFNTDKSWSGGSPGIAPPGVEFHTGASFYESDPIIVYDTKLQGSGGSDLPLHPRMIGFDAGATDLADGDFAMTLFNPDPEAGDLFVRDLQVQFLPRIASIETMIEGAELTDPSGVPVVPRGSCARNPNFTLRDFKTIRIANLADDRYVDFTYDSTDCKPELGVQDADSADVEYCPHGTALSLFPSTIVYVTATIIDPNARYFHPESGQFVDGPLESKVFYQFAGIKPDFNGNGIDDLLDIRNGTVRDDNGNGVPDEVEPDSNGALPWWYHLLLFILLLIIIWLFFRLRKAGK